ncbi:MAG: hypothetical protein HFH62_02960 [Lachnospiraceae bacterium]|nr:hypothetical protein [Lachnospiraceae bacterium]
MHAKRRMISIMLVLLLIINPLLPWMRTTVSAENIQILTIENNDGLYNKLKTALSGALQSSDDANHTITLDMERVTKITLSGVAMKEGNAKNIIEELFSGCSNLSSIQMESCDLSLVDFSGLNNRSSLTNMSFIRCSIDVIPNIKLPQLTTMCITWGNLSEENDCKSLTKDYFPKLTYLYLDACRISDVSFIGKLNKLTKLSLGNNKLTDASLATLRACTNLSGLTHLYLGKAVHNMDGSYSTTGYLSSSNSITDIDNLAAFLESLPNLSTLELQGLKLTSLQGFQNIMERKIFIDMANNMISDFAGFESRNILHLDNQMYSITDNFAKGWGNEIPELMKKVMDQNHALNGNLTYEYCKLSDDGTTLVINPNTSTYNKPVVQVSGGKLDGSRFTFNSLFTLPDPDIPDGLMATEGDTLAKVILPDGYTWEDSSLNVGTPGINTFQAAYAMEEDGNRRYVKYGINVPVSVQASPATPTQAPVSTPTPTPTPEMPTPIPIPTPTPIPIVPTPTPTPLPTPAPVVPTQAPTKTPPSPTPASTKQPTITPTPKPDESKLTGNQIEKRKDLPLQLAVGKQKGSRGIKLTWRKVKDCSGYEVYWSYCDGKQNYKKLKTVKSIGKCQAIHKKLKKNRAYKYYVVTYTLTDGRKNYKSKSPVIHVAMKGEKHTNARKIKVNKSKVTLKAKKTFQIKATAVLENKKKKLLNHDKKFRYYTDNKGVASISKKGKITAKKKGSCSVFVIANNGVAKQIRVTVN